MEPSELLEYDSRLVAITQELPFLEGKPLSLITEEGERSTEIRDYIRTADTSPDRQVYVASIRNHEEDDERIQSTMLNYSQTYPSMSAR